MKKVYDLEARARKREARREQRGMPDDEFHRINPKSLPMAKRPYKKFLVQAQSAKNRGIAWQMTFAEWWGVWQRSGHWHERGNGDGHCMARLGDVGPYSVHNVYITTGSQNIRDSYTNKPYASRAPNKGASRMVERIGKGRGWTFVHKAKHPYQVTLCGKYVGSFSSAVEAECAYREAASSLFFARRG